MKTDSLSSIESLARNGYAADLFECDLQALAVRLIAEDPKVRAEFGGNAAALAAYLRHLAHETKDVPPATLRGPRIGLGGIEELLAAGAPVARELVALDAVGLARRILRQDANAAREFAGDAEVLGAHLRRLAQETAHVAPPVLPARPIATAPTVHATMPSAPAPARPIATARPAVRAAVDAPAASVRRPIAEVQTLAPRMSLAQLLSRAGEEPRRFPAGSADGARSLRDLERLFKSSGLDPVAENPGGLHVDEARARAWLASFASNPAELRHLLAV